MVFKKNFTLILSCLFVISCGLTDFSSKHQLAARAVDNDSQIKIYKVNDSNEGEYPLIIIGANPARQRGYRLRCDNNHDGLNAMLKIFGFNQQSYQSAEEIREVDAVFKQTKVHENPELNCKTPQSAKLYRVDKAEHVTQYYLDFGKSVGGKRIAQMIGCEELIPALGKKMEEAQMINETLLAEFFSFDDEFDLNCNIKDRVEWNLPSGETRAKYTLDVAAKPGKEITPFQLKATVKGQPTFLTQYRIVNSTCGEGVMLNQIYIDGNFQAAFSGSINTNFEGGSCDIVVEAFVANLESQYRNARATITFSLGERLYWQHQDNFTQPNLIFNEDIIPIVLAAKGKNNPNIKIDYAIEPLDCDWLRLDNINNKVRGRVPSATFQKRCQAKAKAFVANDPQIDPLTAMITIEIYNDQEFVFAAGNSHSMAVLPDGTLWGWGANNFGQLGNSTRQGSERPIKIGTDNDWIFVTAGNHFTIAQKKDGSLWSWGMCNDGELGYFGSEDGFTTRPKRIGSDRDWKTVSTHQSHVLALKHDGSLWAWGKNTRGQLGDNSGIEAIFRPIRIGNENNWQSISAGSSHSMAIKTDGSLWGWGNNDDGQLGLELTEQRSVPTRITADLGWQSVHAGTVYTTAIRKDGSAFNWGSKFRSVAAGAPNTFNIYAPTLLSNDNNWKSIRVGDYGATIGLKQDGSIWVWGWNRYGEFGNNSPIDQVNLDPIKMGTEQNWKSVIFSGTHIIATKFDGSVWVWGSNSEGKLGDGTRQDRWTPIKLVL